MLRVVLLGWLWLACAPARAQEDAPEVELKGAPDLAPSAHDLPRVERLLLRQQWIQYREHERDSLRLAGPSIALLLGAGAAATSAWLYTGERNERVAASMVAIFVAAPLLGVSIALLAERVHKRRAIDREVWGTPPVSRGPFRWTF